MARSPKKVFSKTFNTRARKDLIDQDYLDQLSQDELEWLAKFTDEYYGASFDMNAAYMKKDELIELIQSEISKSPAKSKEKWEKHLARIIDQKEKYIQISENEKKSHDIDLRKCRSSNIFYKNENGKYVKNKKYKYADNNIIDPNDKKARKECNDRVNSQRNCILSSFNQVDSENFDIERVEVAPAEDPLIRAENEELEEMLNS